MAWKYDFMKGEIVWTLGQSELIFDGLVDFGSEVESDLELSCGLRENDSSIMDNGLRVIESGV